MLLFEFFPAVVALVALIVGIFLYALNHRAATDPHHEEPPRSPSRPDVPADAADTSINASQRPSMRA